MRRAKAQGPVPEDPAIAAVVSATQSTAGLRNMLYTLCTCFTIDYVGPEVGSLGK